MASHPRYKDKGISLKVKFFAFLVLFQCLFLCFYWISTMETISFTLSSRMKLLTNSSEPRCKIPKIYPFQNSTLELLYSELENRQDGFKEPPCLNPEKFPRFKTDLKSTLLRIEPTSEFWRTVSCCYVPYTGKGINYTLEYIEPDRCIPITENSTIISEEFENICVNCTSISNSSALIYRDYFNFFRLDPTYEAKAQALEDLSRSNGKDYLSVMFYGIDSLGFTNFQRFLPKSREYLLKNMEAIEFSGFNKVGGGTVDNLIPALSGCTFGNWTTGVLFPPGKTECSAIWEKYSEKGYRTVLTHDEVNVWPQRLLREDRKGKTKIHYQNLHYIQGAQSTFRLVLYTFGCFEHQFGALHIKDRTIEVARKLKGHLYYHQIWNQQTTHEFLVGAKWLEEPLYEVLKGLKEGELLNNTVLIIMSDHGQELSSYSTTTEGAIEARISLLYFVFPKWFKDKYSNAIANMKMNSVGLSTHFDLYRTLLDLVDLDMITNNALPHRSITEEPNEKGLSLFLPLQQLTRTCESSHIPLQFCACLPWTQLTDPASDSNVQEIANHVLENVNREISIFPQCHKLEMEQVIDAKMTQDSNGKDLYNVVFQVTPSHGIFAAVVQVDDSSSWFDFGNKLHLTLIGKVVRQDRYGNQSSCLGTDLSKVGSARQACFCK